jgi:hypothetical protein
MTAEVLQRAVYLLVDAGVRYWEDAEVDGRQDVDGTLIPFRQGDRWQPLIRLADGTIEGWPARVFAEIHYKVCDDGVYHLLDENRQAIVRWKGYYVPDQLLCVGAEGFGDYIILEVAGDGEILDWKPPSLVASEWEPVL